MPERIDRRISQNQLLFRVVVIIFAVAAAAGIYIWSLMRSPGVPQNALVPAHPALAKPAGTDERLMVTFFFPSDGMLASGSIAVRRQPDSQSQAREILTALFGDQRTAQTAILKDIKLRELYLDATGTAYVDLAPVPQKEIRASAWEELTAIYAIVNTLTQNIDEIKRIRVLLDGREVQTLAGHIDLSRSFGKRVDLVKQ